MSGIIALAKSFIPPAKTVERQIFYLCPFLFFYPGSDRGRYDATIASLSLQNRLEVVNDPLINWIKKDLKQDAIKNPVPLLMISHFFDLVRKVIASAAFYATSQYSLYATLSTLFSQSQRVSQVAQPHLDKIASLPIPRLLKATQVIAFAPVVIKLIQMALIYVDPNGKNSSLNTFKKTADQAGRGLECLLHLRLSLISLGVSENVLGCVVKTMYSQAVDYFIKDPQLNNLVKLPLWLKPAYGKEATGLSYFLSVVGCTDKSMWPSLGFDLAINALLTALSASSDSFDIDCLQKLFDRIEAITIDQASITQLQKDITQAAKKNKIDTAFENRLLDRLRTKVLTLCITDSNFEASLQTKGRRVFLKTICCPRLNSPQAEEFFNFLVKLSKFEVKLDDLEETLISIYGLKMNELFKENLLSEFVAKKIETAFSDENIDQIIQNPKSLSCAGELLSSFSHTSEECQQIINQTKSRFFTKIKALLPQEINANGLEDENEEKKIYNLATTLSRFAVTPEEQTNASFHLVYVRTRRFQINLESYLGNQLQFPNDKIVLEQMLDVLARDTFFDLNTIKQSEAFLTWSSENGPSGDVKKFIAQSPAFAFLKNYPKIPAEFRFETQRLAKAVHDIYSYYEVPNEDGWSYKANFPDSDQPQDSFVSTKAIQAALN
jgi:hypothetical protein